MTQPEITREEAFACAESLYQTLVTLTRRAREHEPDIMYALPLLCELVHMTLNGHGEAEMLAYALLRSLPTSEAP